jgi:hypothetical protein
MKQRLLLDRVDINRARIPIYYRSQHPVDIDSDAALAALAGLEQTTFRTQLTLNYQFTARFLRRRGANLPNAFYCSWRLLYYNKSLVKPAYRLQIICVK